MKTKQNSKSLKETKKTVISNGFKQFIIKTVIFVLIFILTSLLIGQKIVESTLLYGFGLAIYGGMGYLLLFCIMGFIFLYRDNLFKLEKYPRNKIDHFIIFCSIILIGLFYLLELNINLIEINFVNKLIVHLLFISMLALLAIGIYTLRFTIDFIRQFKRELSYFALFFIIAYSLMDKIWALWPYLSRIVGDVTNWLLHLVSSDIKYYIDKTDNLPVIIFKGFGAKVAEACSGIYSIFIFIGLYLFILFIDWKKLNKLKAFALFLPAAIGAFAVNIFRVFLLMILGALVSKEIALGLYHSYTGMIFFMVYFIIFWLVAYKWMKKKDIVKENKVKKKFKKK